MTVTDALSPLSFLPGPYFWDGAVAALVFVLMLLALQRLLGQPAADLEETRRTRRPAFDPSLDGSEDIWERNLDVGDRRRSPRRNGQPTPLDLRVLDGDEPFTACVIDRSATGLRLSSSRPVPTGGSLQLRPHGAADDTPWTPAEVRWCRKSDEGYEIGCEFIVAPPWEVLIRFG